MLFPFETKIKVLDASLSFGNTQLHATLLPPRLFVLIYS